MQVGKWGDDLALRLPATVVEHLGLKEGDDVVIEILGPGQLRITRDQAREEAVAHLRALDWKPPPGFRFNRDEANER